MRLYFDSNVYDFIATAGETKSVKQLLKSGSHSLLASELVLLELLAIPQSAKRESTIGTVTELASTFAERPESWLHAEEIRHEIVRCRPNWLRKVVFKRQMRQFLQGHSASWIEAQALELPAPATFAVYRRDFEEGVRGVRHFQRERRKDRRMEETRVELARLGAEEPASPIDLADPECAWRVYSLLAWYNAIALRMPSSRDYADWLMPYLKERAFADPSFARFWLEDIEGQLVPRNRLTGLISHYQTDRSITHGNAMDQLHGCKLLDVDLLVTADRSLYEILATVRETHSTGGGRVVLVDRRLPFVADQLANALRSA